LAWSWLTLREPSKPTDYGGPVNALPYAIFRDASGRILGSTDTSRSTALELAPGDSVGSITVTDWLPAGLDTAHIEVYLRPTGLA